jgi:hypothetical protein
MAGVDFDGAYTAKTRGPAGTPFSLGQRMQDADGNEFVYVQANGAITAGDVVILTEAFQADALDTTNSAGAIGDKVGVAKGTLADDDYGWVQIFGVASAVNATTGATANTVLNSTGTAGRVNDDATGGTESITGLYITATAADNTAAGILNYPFIAATL